jgi:hypothetical protein
MQPKGEGCLLSARVVVLPILRLTCRVRRQKVRLTVAAKRGTFFMKTSATSVCVGIIIMLQQNQSAFPVQLVCTSPLWAKT